MTQWFVHPQGGVAGHVDQSSSSCSYSASKDWIYIFWQEATFIALQKLSVDYGNPPIASSSPVPETAMTWMDVTIITTI